MMKCFSLFLLISSAVLFVPVVMIFSVLDGLCAEPSDNKTGNSVQHISVGEIDFYSIQDAPLDIGNDMLITENQDILTRFAPTGKALSSFGVFVVKKREQILLIDTGTGGKLLECLEIVGIKPDEVKNILLTHAHGDHVDGLIKEGQKVFPNAEIWLEPREQKFWKTSQNKGLYEQCLKLYGQPKRIVADEKTNIIFSEIVAVDLAGHTPGHTGFLISSKGEKLLMAADLLHSKAVQFAAPDVRFQADNDQEQAIAIRKKTLRRAAEEQWLFVASHLPFPHAGYVKKSGEAFQFNPLPDHPTESSDTEFLKAAQPQVVLPKEITSMQKTVPPTPIRVLRLDNTDTNDAELAKICTVYPELVELTLGGTKVTDAGIVHLIQLKKLKKIRLSKTAVTDAGMTDLGKCEMLEDIDVSQTKIGDVGVWKLKNLSRLKNLNFYLTLVTDSGLDFFTRDVYRSVQKIERLNLDKCAVTDAGIPKLASMVNLKWIHLGGTAITDAGLAELRKLTVPQEIIITKTETTDAGIEQLRQDRPDLMVRDDISEKIPQATINAAVKYPIGD